MFYKKIDVADNERAFLFEKNRFAGVLEPGRHRYFDVRGDIQLERFDVTQYELEHPLGKFLVTQFADKTRDYLASYQLSDYELGLLYRDGQLVDIVAPGSFKIYWKGPEKLELKRVDISEEYSFLFET